MKKYKVLIILAVILLFGAGALLMLPDGQTQQEAAPAPSGTVILAATDIHSLDFRFPDEQYSLTREDGVWRCPQEPELPIDPERTWAMEQALGRMTAIRTADIPPEECGLDEPQLTLAIHGAAEWTLAIGDYNPHLDACYVLADGDAAVYLVPSPDLPFLQGLLALAKFDPMPQPSYQQVQTLRVENGQGSFSCVQIADGSRPCYTDEFTWFSESGSPVESVTVYKLIAEATDISLLRLAAFRPEPEELRSMGLTEPDTAISLEVPEGRSLHLSVSAPVAQAGGPDRAYLTWDGTDMVFEVYATAVGSIRSLDEQDLIPGEICLITPAHLTGARASRNGSEEAVDSSLLPSLADALYQMRAERFVDTAPQEEIALELILETDIPGYETMTLTFHPYDESFYQVSFLEEQRQLVGRNALHSLLRLLGMD